MASANIETTENQDVTRTVVRPHQGGGNQHGIIFALKKSFESFFLIVAVDVPVGNSLINPVYGNLMSCGL